MVQNTDMVESLTIPTEVIVDTESLQPLPSSSTHFLVRNRSAVGVLLMLAFFGIASVSWNDNKITKIQMSVDATTTATTPSTRTIQETIERKKSDDSGDSVNSAAAANSDMTDNKISTKAADALECRESVIAFVINATDAKDECDGLKRAFDKTCNSDQTQEIIDKSAEKELAVQAKAAAAAAAPGPKKSRRLFDKEPETTLRWKVLVHQTARWLTKILNSWKQDAFFFSEDHVVLEWDDAKYQVEQGLDTILHKDTIRRIQEEIKAEDTAKEEKEDEVTVVVPKVEKPKQSLTLPTSNEHLSGKMLSETLLLQNEDTIQSAIRTAANHTNATLNEAAVDAVISAKAVQDTTAVVSAVLNDPTSVEARTCCASILNVFHENCDQKEEETVSDKKLFLIVFVIAFCGMVKSMIRHFQIRWLPEAAGCILVGGKLVHRGWGSEVYVLV
jgi:hypothetical protein